MICRQYQQATGFEIWRQLHLGFMIPTGTRGVGYLTRLLKPTFDQQLRGILHSLGVGTQQIRDRQSRSTPRRSEGRHSAQRDQETITATPSTASRNEPNVQPSENSHCGVLQVDHSFQQNATGAIQHISTRDAPRRSISTNGHRSNQQKKRHGLRRLRIQKQERQGQRKAEELLQQR